MNNDEQNQPNPRQYPTENSLLYAETRHPVDFIEPITEVDNPAREQAREALSRVFVWIASGTGIRQMGLRALVVLYIVRSDLINGATLEQIGGKCGCSKQAVFNLVRNFHESTGL